ncbi:MAG: hypothetical protein COZ18_12085 [Flexibacter sp. CG_4_10_14_3_um_filter_32_15]|nr:MAG: hypothetical protein COZ18_12085 [Flexibacter sp. CG_4_10_14_3_um_filter_32_15]
MNLPQGITNRETIDPKLAVGSSLKNPKELFAILFLLYLVNEEEVYLDYSYTKKEEKNKIFIQKDFIDKIILFFSNIDEVDKSKIESIAANSPLVTMQMEPLQVSLQIYWKLAKIGFIDSDSSSKERTGQARFMKDIYFTTNMDLLKFVLSDDENIVTNKAKYLLYNWLTNETVTEDFSELENKLKKTLLIFTEDTLFKTWESASKEIIFQQEGIYEKIVHPFNSVNLKGAKEIKGTLRNLKSIISNNLHPYFILSKDDRDKIEVITSSSSEFSEYAGRVSSYLDLVPKSIIINNTEDLSEVDTTENNTNPPLQTIYYGSPVQANLTK